MRRRVLLGFDLVLLLDEEFTVAAAVLRTAQQFHVDVHFVQLFSHGLLFNKTIADKSTCSKSNQMIVLYIDDADDDRFKTWTVRVIM